MAVLSNNLQKVALRTRPQRTNKIVQLTKNAVLHSNFLTLCVRDGGVNKDSRLRDKGVDW